MLAYSGATSVYLKYDLTNAKLHKLYNVILDKYYLSRIM